MRNFSFVSLISHYNVQICQVLFLLPISRKRRITLPSSISASSSERSVLKLPNRPPKFMPSQCGHVCLLLYLAPFSFGLTALLPPLHLLHEKIIESIFIASQPSCCLAESTEPLLASSYEMFSIHMIPVTAQFCLCPQRNSPFQ